MPVVQVMRASATVLPTVPAVAVVVSLFDGWLCGPSIRVSTFAYSPHLSTHARVSYPFFNVFFCSRHYSKVVWAVHLLPLTGRWRRASDLPHWDAYCYRVESVGIGKFLSIRSWEGQSQHVCRMISHLGGELCDTQTAMQISGSRLLKEKSLIKRSAMCVKWGLQANSLTRWDFARVPMFWFKIKLNLHWVATQ